MLDEREISQYFDKSLSDRISLAHREDAIGFNYRQKVAWFVGHLRNARWRLLDVGCNVGNLAFLIRASGVAASQLEVTGIDIAGGSVDAATQRQIKGATFLVGSALDLPFDNGSFDAVTFMEVIEHIPSQSRALAEARRVLKPGGLVLLSTPNAECKPWIRDERMRHLAKRLLGKHEIEKDNPLTRDALTALVCAVGLEPIEGPRYYWYRPYQVFARYPWWPPHLAWRGQLYLMKHYTRMEESGQLSEAQKRFCCQSLLVAARKPLGI
jgi:SAM-dependent methyltransferase